MFKKEARGLEVVFCVICCTIFSIIYGLTAGFIAEKITGRHCTVDFGPINALPLIFFSASLFFSALAEEIFFRAPLVYVASIFQSIKITLIAAAIFSIIFGMLHGGLRNILIQGVMGFLFSMSFLKCGGFHGKVFKPLLSATSAHFLYNFIIFFIKAGG